MKNTEDLMVVNSNTGLQVNAEAPKWAYFFMARKINAGQIDNVRKTISTYFKMAGRFKHLETIPKN
jgi:hypothetical protein